MNITRRDFLRGLNLSIAGLAIGFYGEKAVAKLLTEDPPAGLTPNVFVHIAPDGAVTIVCHRSEMGQGIRSTLPQLLADEMGADMARVKIEQGDGDKAYGDQNTDGSSSIRKRYEEMRKLAGTARVMLVAAAAKKWGVRPTSCNAHNHVVEHLPTRRKFTFGELVADAAKLPVPKLEDVKPRPDKEMHLRGNPPIVDAPAIVDGKAIFGADVRLPGMLIAVIARPPVVGGKIKSLDSERAMKIPGVKSVIRMPVPTKPYTFQPWGGVAVVAENTWAAMRGRAALDITWDDGDNADYDSDKYKEKLLASAREPGKVLREVGDAEGALAGAAKVIEAEYHVPHLAHAPMEPPAALARVEGGRAEIWACTQNPQAARKTAATVLNVGEDKVQVHVTLLGGGFGRKSKADFVAEAVFLAREMKVPVRVQFTREDDIRHDYYNTVSGQKISAGLDKKGRVVAWRHRTAFPPISSTFANTNQPSDEDLQQGILDLALAVPNVRAESCKAEAQARIGWMRSVYNIFHAFSVGSFVDELAHANGKDPRDMWLELIGPSRVLTLKELGIPKLKNYDATYADHPVDAGRLRHVIDRVTQQSGWSRRKRDGRSFGLAAHRSFLSYVATVVALKKDADGKPRIDEAWLVADAGTVVNLDRAKSQMEGALVFGMSIALHGAVTMKGGATEQSNFYDYRLMRMNDTPRKLHVDIIESKGKPCGIGEPGVPPVAPAIANALFAMTGKRVRELPLERHHLS